VNAHPTCIRLRDPWLTGVCVSRVLLYANYMVYAASLPVVRVEWNVTAAQAALVSTGFTLAYSVSLVLFSALADRWGPRRIAMWSAGASAVTALAFGVAARSYGSALLFYSLVGLAQGGVYTPLIMLMADRYAPSDRGRAVGWLIASTSIGYATSLVVAGLALAAAGYRLAFLLTGMLPAVGAALLLLALRTTPDPAPARSPAPRIASSVLRQPADAWRLIGGYSAHSWELLGMWAWMPAFLAAVVASGERPISTAADRGAYFAAGLHLLGALAAMTMGRLSDSLGRRRVLLALALASAVLSLTVGWTVAWPLWLVLPLAVAYNFAALGDSPVLSAALTEVVGPARLGTILGLRSLFGFGAGALAPWVFGLVLDWSNPGTASPSVWGWAFMVLGAGGLVAAGCAWTLEKTGAYLSSDSAYRRSS
jgi:MFS family permease